MDFFRAQEQARQQTRLLVLYFITAVACIVAAINVALWFGLVAITEPPQPAPLLWDLERWLVVSGVVLVVILGASLVRTLQFRQGGGSVARALGGKRVDPSTRDPHERRLVNVVEEMAIASGIPLPEIYILEGEEGINAFAAGLETHDAAVAVTRGALEQLSRDELQGVIAHEFAHIMNGDMRINVRMAGIIFGIIVLALIGRVVMYSMYFSGGRRSSGRNQGGGGAMVVVMIVGLTLLLVGIIGELFGRLIQAAISRRREYLADAAAVQFTRNPDGIAGALKRIGAGQSRVTNSAASGMAHFFFASAMKSSMVGAFSTHPPLPKRIRAVDPHWDGSFPKPGERISSKPKPTESKKSNQAGAGRRGLKTGQPVWDLGVMMAAIGTLDKGSMDCAQRLMERWPERLRDTVHQREGAKAVLCGLIWAAQESGDLPTPMREKLGAEWADTIDGLLPDLRALPEGNRLPLAEVALGQLRELMDSESERLEAAMLELVHADGEESLFESCILQLFRKQVRKGSKSSSKTGLAQQIESVSRILSRLVYLEIDEQADASDFFERVSKGLRERWQSGLQLVGPDALKEANPATDFAVLESLPLVVKGWVLEACVTAVIDNQSVSERESEWLRVIALTLDCPMPLLLPGPIENPMAGAE
ncbi:MAG: M48 family metallopeptidase [Opitutales bacterium]|nr:M48 family metallopeptidase [Opitutales bacterium]